MANSCTRSALKSATILTSALLLSSGGALAQSNEDPTLNPITLLGRIVFGTGGSETVAIDTPQAVTVLNQEDIDRAQATTVGELFETVPGVQSIGSGRVAGESFNIRGIGSLAASDESRIIITVDGATKFYEQYRLGSFFSDPELYKQVEILRGPASSTLYGSGALGGVINFETKDASDFLTDGINALRTRLSYSSNSEEFLGSLIYATRPSENFDTLVALQYREADDYTTGDGSEIGGSAFDSASGLVKSNLYFGDSLDQVLTFSYTRWDSELQDTEYSQTGTLGFGTVDRHIVDDTIALRYQNPVSGNPLFDFDVVLAYSNTQNEQYDSSFGCFGSPLFCDSEYAYETTSLKVENTATFGAGIWQTYLTTGVQLSHQERLATTEIGDLGFHPEGTDDRVGLYAQAEMIWNERLTIVPGIRADFAELTANEDSGLDDVSEVAISPKIAALYDISETVNIFGSLARTQRVPTIDEFFSTDADEPNSPDLEMETANSVELGASFSRQSVLSDNDAFQVKATLFYSEIDDLIAREDTAGTPYYANVDAATIHGIELEAAYESEAVFVRSAYSDVRGTDDATGETLDSIPARTLNLTVGKRIVALDVEYGWQGNFVDDIAYGTDEYDSYEVHDLFVGWKPQQGALQGVQANFRVSNVLDKQYTNSLAGDAGEGRSYNVSLTKTFEF
ncbi:TonB-dependent receptor domain-containing protein [Yoonia sp. BS5-3]|uniref:TonB-dependent receptor domain-containing protein n=1 Tax=Yoonia phaeophyticola TaxID=3137369 RepID=A0ABZ2V4Y7_9RHOB